MRVLCPFWSLDLVVGPCPVSQVSHVTETCEQYVDVLVAPASGTSEAGGDESVARSRWRDELANRRQLASYLATMTDDLREDKVELEAAVTGFRACACACVCTLAVRIDGSGSFHSSLCA